MKIKLSAHGAYRHQYYIVWLPKYRRKVLKGTLKQYLEKGLFEIERFHPDVNIETLSIPTVCPGVTCVVVDIYGCGSGRIWPARCAVIVAVRGFLPDFDDITFWNI
jgi:hypothetical protein